MINDGFHSGAPQDSNHFWARLRGQGVVQLLHRKFAKRIHPLAPGVFIGFDVR